MMCNCEEGYLRNRTGKFCYPDPKWCHSGADCKDGKICCRFFLCDVGAQQECKASREVCVNLMGCGGHGTVIGEGKTSKEDTETHKGMESSDDENEVDNEQIFDY